MTTIKERLDAAQARSVKLYLHRQALEQQLQRISVEKMQCEMEMARSDGEIDCLIAQMAEEQVAS